MVNSKHYRFLFIDDSPTDNKYLSLLIRIKKLPITPHFEYSAQKALDYLLKCEEDKFPEVIMIDIGMPLMDGFEFVENYVALFPNQNNTLLYITSSSVQISDRKKTKVNPNIKAFIEKPFNLQQFQNTILPDLGS